MGDDDVFDDSTEGEHLTRERDLLRMSQDLYKVHAPCSGKEVGTCVWSTTATFLTQDKSELISSFRVDIGRG